MRVIMKKIVLIIFLFNSYAVFAQNESGKDSTAFLDSIFNEMDQILDELIPKKITSAQASGPEPAFSISGTLQTKALIGRKK